MRLVSFGPAENERAGALAGDRILDLNAFDPAIPASVKEILQQGAVAKAREALASAERSPKAKWIERGRVRLGAPIPRPGLIVCLGLNYRDHADEQGTKYPEAPLLFSKAPMAAAGPEDPIAYPADVRQLDYEVELAVVIGRRAKGIAPEAAREFIAGYCAFNDVSARCAQFGDKQWFRGKSYDGFAPFGPALVTADEVPDPMNLRLTCKVNGEVRQDSNTSCMIHDVFKTVAYVSRGITLMPGDVIATGTPAGVGIFFKPSKLLQRGDVVELEVAGVGKLVNRVI